MALLVDVVGRDGALHIVEHLLGARELALPRQHAPELLSSRRDRLRVVLAFALHDGTQHLLSLGEAAQKDERLGCLLARFGVAGIELERLVVVVQRLVQVADPVGVGQTDVRRDRRRIERQRLVVGKPGQRQPTDDLGALHAFELVALVERVLGQIIAEREH